MNRTTSLAFSLALLLGGLSMPAYSSTFGLWEPVDPADLSAKTPKIDPDADVEAIFYEQWVSNELSGDYGNTILQTYVRLKVFNERGKQWAGNVQIPYPKSGSISGLAGRTIQPDGTIVELKSDAIFDKVLVKAGNYKVRVKSFALPGVDVGSVIEYRWKEVRTDIIQSYVRLDLQQEYPVVKNIAHVKPLVSPRFPYAMRVQPFACRPSPFQPERNGFYTTFLENVPAHRQEPMMPPTLQSAGWILFYYTEDKKLNPDKYWPALGRESYGKWKGRIKIDGTVKDALAEAVGNAASDEEKLRSILNYVRAKVKNLSADNATGEDRIDFKSNKTGADALRQGAGSIDDLNLAFASLATAAGFDVRLCRVSNRNRGFFDANFTDDYMLSAIDVAVKLDGKWSFYDASETFLPAGMLNWNEEGVAALLADPKEAGLLKTPMTEPVQSMAKRRGRFALSEDGSIKGNVSLEFTGHQAAEKRRELSGKSEAEMVEFVTQTVKAQFPAAEVSAVKALNISDWDKPVIWRYLITIPEYADRTGKRLFVQTSLFERGSKPLFTSSKRANDVYFHYGWSEDDEVVIRYPDSYALDHADAPAGLNLGDIGDYKVTITHSADTHDLIYRRKFEFGRKGTLLFPVKSYPQLKALFETIHSRDEHALTLKQSGSAPAAAAKTGDGQ